MKCLWCINAGEKSTVQSHGASVTLMAVNQHWDEDGNLVVKDPNIRREVFSCSKGHRWFTETQHGMIKAQGLIDG